jgi:hypothetical protein
MRVLRGTLTGLASIARRDRLVGRTVDQPLVMPSVQPSDQRIGQQLTRRYRAAPDRMDSPTGGTQHGLPRNQSPHSPISLSSPSLRGQSTLTVNHSGDFGSPSWASQSANPAPRRGLWRRPTQIRAEPLTQPQLQAKPDPALPSPRASPEFSCPSRLRLPSSAASHFGNSGRASTPRILSFSTSPFPAFPVLFRGIFPCILFYPSVYFVPPETPASPILHYSQHAAKGAAPMLMKSGQRWHCTNSACRAEVVVCQGSLEGSNPRCACGAVLKKEYAAPVFRYLDFLHLSASALSEPTLSGRASPEPAPRKD